MLTLQGIAPTCVGRIRTDTPVTSGIVQSPVLSLFPPHRAGKYVHFQEQQQSRRTFFAADIAAML